MSTVKVVNVQHPSASTAAVTLAADGSMTGAFPAPNRNLLYNGAMQVAQRGTSTAGITGGNYYTADRWYFNPSSMGTWTQSVENDAPSGSGLRKSVKLLCTTADASPAAGDYVGIRQGLEGQDLQRVAKGTASAQQLTLSFWVKANVTGTYVAELYDIDNGRSVSASYTISASATWEKKSITFPADTTGAFDNDNALSLEVYWWLGLGSTYTSGTLQTAWNTRTNGNIGPGQTNLAATTNNYWQITGVQLEVGPVATGFEFKSFGQELAECQRYYYASAYHPAYENGATGLVHLITCPTPLRAQPTPSTDIATITYTNWGVGTYSVSGAVSVNYFSTTRGNVLINQVATGLPGAGRGIVTAGTVILNAEL